MRTRRAIVLLGLALAATGCKALEGYYYPAEHFAFATVTEEQFNGSMEHTLNNLGIVLRENEIGVRKREVGEESAQVWARKEGLNYVFDLKSMGDGCHVHFEIDQVGNDDLAWRIMRDLQNLP